MRGVFAAIWAWGGSDECTGLVSSFNPSRTVSVSSSPVFFPGTEAVSLSFQSWQMVTECLLRALGGGGCSVLPLWANIW